VEKRGLLITGAQIAPAIAEINFMGMVRMADSKEKSSLEHWLGLVPQLSAAALVLATFFNIGFFTIVGIHFLGIVDIGNLGYSFALALGGLASLALIVDVGSIERLRKFAKEKDAVSRSASISKTLVFVGSVIAIAATVLANNGTVSRITEVSMYVCGLLLISLCKSTETFVRFCVDKKIYPQSFIVAALAATATIMFVGQCVALGLLSRGDVVTVETKKNGAIGNARLLRTSGSGYLIAIDGIVQFIPSGEVQRIQARDPIKE
jgi:hypothetical protein